ncbi:MAG TPA: hypothetical protein VJ901_07105 [Thermoanaerobaculia bacterium]|nr:hypothetical protein [Thermoanaerobaculia bacterium]
MLRRLLPLLLFAAIAAHGDPLPADLRGGHFATFTLDAKYVDARAEEWEAFLSVDGGQFYSVRLTPHLDITLRSYDVLLPNVESADARILIRTGNERVERLQEIPQHFRIHADPDAVAPLARSANHAPEAARPGEANVVVWADASGIHSTNTIPHNCHDTLRNETSEEWPTVVPAHFTLARETAVSRRITEQLSNSATQQPQKNNILLLITRLNV